MIHILECEQGSPEWYAARLGRPTASEFHTILAKGKDGGASLTREKYLLSLAGERLTAEPMDSYCNGSMERGRAMEGEARNFYSFMREVELRQVGFITNGPNGCSPDSLIGDTGMLEIKTKAAHILIKVLLKDEFPPEHKAQCQGALWIAEREWIDLACYWPKLPLFVKRAYRDDGYIATLAGAVNRFNEELAETVERIKCYGCKAEAA